MTYVPRYRVTIHSLKTFFFVWLGVNFVKMLEHGTRVRMRVIFLKLVVAKEAIIFLTSETKRGVVACWIIGVLGPSCDIPHCGQQPVECPSTLCFVSPPPLPSNTCPNETETSMLDMTCRVASWASITQVEVTEGVLASYCEYRRIESKLRFYQLLTFPNN